MAHYNFRAFLAGCGTTRRFQRLADAEHFARRQCAIDGATWRLESMADGSNGEIIAHVRRDAYDRIWTDLEQSGNALI